MEQWRDIKGYFGRYQVSSLGNVRSMNWRNTGEPRCLFLKPHTRGYLQVELHLNGSRKMFLVHRLVAEHFLPLPAGESVVNHINEDKTDNRVENLEWVSQSYNTLYSLHRRTIPSGRKSRGGRPVEQIKDGSVLSYWANIAEVVNTMGYNHSSIKRCCEGKRKTAYGCEWRYVV